MPESWPLPTDKVPGDPGFVPDINQFATNLNAVNDRLNGAWRFGEGAPEGVVTAEPGTMYRNISATLGNAVYRKNTGSGATGWKVQGDTGWRALRTWDATGAVTGAAFTTGWGPRTGQAGYMWLRRTNDEVHLAINNFQANSASPSGVLVDIPTGFRSANHVLIKFDWVSAGAMVFGHLGSAFVPLLAPTSGAWAGYGSFRWLTSEAWPSTLPGSAL